MSMWVVAARFLGVGFFIGSAIVLGVLAGLWLDSKFDTGPVLAIVGLVLGIIVAFFGTYRMILTNINNTRNRGER
jgi:F0F1-type ATP synthase assembly protein I